MTDSIAIIGMGCRYPDARSPAELWENVLAQRRAFRLIPDERLRLADYFSTDPQSPDALYSTQAAVIEGYEFDRRQFRISGATYRSADLSHWLALDVADQTLKDGGFPNGENLPRETTGVFLGNTLTGEFSRASQLRLRWPYVRRVVDACLKEENWPFEQRRSFLERLETNYKAPFSPVSEETLAGGLSNTIAGRICNYFDFNGGGYTVDGACASSLLAVANACRALLAHDIDAALAGGVDLSLDPFELVGFAKATALATDVMRVYDAKSNGFWPGEGCGFVLLMRYQDAVKRGYQIYASIEGWGISSDGEGGLIRPKISGQMHALERAYRLAAFPITTVGYFEGHGTGTAFGDATELQVLSNALGQGHRKGPPPVIGSIKAIIGHTKAAAGMAGLIKTVQVLQSRIMPPTAGCEDPHSILKAESAALRVLKKSERWPAGQQLRAAVSAMGFGGINSHIVLQRLKEDSPRHPDGVRGANCFKIQDCEIFLLSANTLEALREQLDHLLSYAAKLSYAELSDLAAALERQCSPARFRAACVAANASQLAERLDKLRTIVTHTEETHLDTAAGIFFSSRVGPVRVGFLFPGQASPSHIDGGALGCRFDFVAQLYEQAKLVSGQDQAATHIAQPAIVTASLATLRVLRKLGISATVAIGNSLGELTALHWAGALNEQLLLRLVKLRGKLMADNGGSTGAMAGIEAGQAEVEGLLNGHRVVIAGLNAPRQTIIAGESQAISEIVEKARATGRNAVRLNVSHAFHSPMMVKSAELFAATLANEHFKQLRGAVVSTITGEELAPATNIPALLTAQITSPVRFMEAVYSAEQKRIDIWLEVGPGRVLGDLLRSMTPTPAISIDGAGQSLRGLLNAVASLFVMGETIHHHVLFEDRFVRPFDLQWKPKFFANPCESAPADASTRLHDVPEQKPEPGDPVQLTAEPSVHTKPLEVFTQLVAKQTEFAAEEVTPQSRLSSDLHLSSIVVAQLVARASRELGIPGPVSTLDFADATVEEVAEALEGRSRPGPTIARVDSAIPPAGIGSWIRAYQTELAERARPRRKEMNAPGQWQVFGPAGHWLVDALRKVFTGSAGGTGVVLYLGKEESETIRLLMNAAKIILQQKSPAYFVLVQHSALAGAFARTLQLEEPNVTVCVITVPEEQAEVVEWILAEVESATSYVEAYYDGAGRRYTPVLRLMSTGDTDAAIPLSHEDVMVVSGGGKGITAECALDVATTTGVRLALLGRSLPENDIELATNLERMTAAGVEFRYVQTDVMDASMVRSAIQQIEEELGAVTTILHGSAVNDPRLIRSLDEHTFRETLAVKVAGARNLLAAVDADKLKLLITFGSIIARTGLPGEAHYGMANEQLTALTQAWQDAHPQCRCLAVEWSVWSSLGMGERLAQTEMLARRDVSRIAPEQGIAILKQLLRQRQRSVAVLVMGRFGDLPTFQIERPALPFHRFLEEPGIHYPNVELVVDVELSTSSDLYLNDHQFQGTRLFPSVIGLEAMAQVAMALSGAKDPPVFENVRFSEPVIVPETATTKIRLAALALPHGRVKVALRSEETGFQRDHFAAECVFGPTDASAAEPASRSLLESANGWLPLMPGRDLYGDILFHTGRFQRIKDYRVLRSTECLAEILRDEATPWFSQYLPQQRVLGDPGARDAAIHAVQACIPHVTLLPVSVDRICLEREFSSESIFVHAQERTHADDVFVYDLSLMDSTGVICETWQGLHLKAVAKRSNHRSWKAPLLGPLIERRIRDLIPGSNVSVALVQDSARSGITGSDRAIQIALGHKAAIFRRGDGKPEIAEARKVSVSHLDNLILAVANQAVVSCDIELANRSPSLWRDVLSENYYALAKLISQRINEDEGVSAARVWAAGECLSKIGATPASPLLLLDNTSDGWVVVGPDHFRIATFATKVACRPAEIVIALLVANGAPSETLRIPAHSQF